MKEIDINELADLATSYADGFSKALRESGLSTTELKEKLLDANVEQCPNCKWWVDSMELIEEDYDIDGYCLNCRKYDKPDQ